MGYQLVDTTFKIFLDIMMVWWFNDLISWHIGVGCKSGKCFDPVDPAVFHFTCASFVRGKGLSVFADVYRLQPDDFDSTCVSLRMGYVQYALIVLKDKRKNHLILGTSGHLFSDMSSAHVLGRCDLHWFSEKVSSFASL
jgi:hypothetical protein